MARVISIVCQKGGVGKTSSSVNLGVGLARRGKKVLLIDADSQGSLSISLGITDTKRLTETIASIMSKIISESPVDPAKGILKQTEGVDVLPANNDLAAMEMFLVNVYGREGIMREYINMVSPNYDYIIIDTQPSLGMMTVNALTACNSVIIPVQAEYLAVKGLEQLLSTVSRIKKRINKSLVIDGIIVTMLDERVKESKELMASVKNAYGGQIHIFSSIPRSIKVSEAAKSGISIYTYAPNSKAALAYETFTGEVLSRE